MRHIPTSRPGTVGTCLIAALLTISTAQAPAALTDLATSPLQSAAPNVKPNLLFILDDSGSMSWDFMPDWAERGADSLVRNSGYNATYYNPAIRYRPPIRKDGSEYPSMSAATTSNWTRVPFDGFGVQTARGTGNNLFTGENSGATQNLVGQATYYTFIPGEYCTDRDLKTCVERVTPSDGYPYPALLRWCSSANPNDCRATRIEPAQRNGPGYISARAPGVSGVPGRNMRVNIVSNNNSYAYPGTDDKAPNRDDCPARTCTYAEEMSNYANWWAYYRTRMQMAKSAASLAFNEIDSKFRIGYMSINNNTGTDFLNVLDVDSSPTGQKYQWYGKLLAAEPGNSTPLRTALSTAGRYFSAKTTSVNGVTSRDPMQYACQRNYTLLSTDGYWNDRNEPGGMDANADIGDQDGNAQAPYRDGNRTPNTLADIAQYFFATDIRDRNFGNTNGALGKDVASNDVPDKRQTMRTSTVGLGASGYMQYRDDYASATTGDYAAIAQGKTASNDVCEWQASGGTCTWPRPQSNAQTTIDDLWHAAVNGRGTYYSAADPEQLKKGLTDFINEVARGGAVQVTPPAVSSLNLTENDNISFDTMFTAGDWFGDLIAYTRNPKTAARTGVVLWSQSEEKDSVGGSKTRPILDNRAAADRKIYTYEPATNRASGLIPFTWAAMGDETRRHFRVGNIGTLSQLCSTGSACLPAGVRIDSDNTGPGSGVGGVNLVNFLRGDRSLEGAPLSKYYRQRVHVMGDVVDARPVYVKKPLFSYGDTGYDTFRTAQSTRTGMLYVGANDGMLHAFRADTGAEAWAYVPSLLLPKMHKLADKDYANRHTFYVNATPHHGDVFYDGRWRTILVGGLGQGGRGYYALDITDAEQAPKVLWEFTHDRSRNTGYVADEDMGYSYGKPVITKIADGTWVVIVASGYNNISPGTGRGFIWVLNAWTGQVIRKIDTGAGSLDSKQPGCSATPCPAGLAHLKVFASNADRNNLGLRVYGGDLLGILWRFDISKLTAGGGSASVTRLATLIAPDGSPQPVTSPPSLGTISGFGTVFIGTGAYLGLSDLTTTGKQSFYAVKDPLTSVAASSSIHGNPREKTCGTAASLGCFVKQNVVENSNGERNNVSTVSYAVDFKTMGGWYIDLPKTGERVVSPSELQGNVLAFTSGIPSSNTACAVDGSSYLNYVNPSTGLAIPGATGTGVLLKGLSGLDGLTLVTTADGKRRALTSDGGSSSTGDPPPAKGTRRISWRELITDQ